MVDLSKHLARAKQAVDRNNFEMALEVLDECIDVDPANIDVHKLLIDAAKRKAKMNEKKSLFGGLGGSLSGMMMKDPHKLFAASAKRLGKNYEAKALAECGEMARRMAETGVKAMTEVAILYFEDFRTTGLFNDKVLWNLGNLYYERFKNGGQTDMASLDKAIALLVELEKAMPHHPEAGKVVKNWHAAKSIANRNKVGNSGDFRSQLSSEDKARDAEILNRMVRTIEDAQDLVRVVDKRLAEAPGDKQLWVKKGDVLARFRQQSGFADQARAAFEKAQAIDPHDFVVTMKLSDLRLATLRDKVEEVTAAGGDITEAKTALVTASIEEFRKRVERQPTDMGHRFNLGKFLIESGNIEAAAAEFQRTVNDPRLRRDSHRLLGYCFARKNLLDLARQQYDAYLSITEDDTTDEAKGVRYNRARILEQLTRKPDAIADYNRLVVIDLGYKDAAERLNKLQAG